MLRRTIVKIIANSFNLDLDEIETLGDDTSFYEIGLTSLTMISILTDLEERFDFQIPSEELVIDHFDTINKLLYLVQSKSKEILTREEAWDLMGAKFWEQGRQSARPNHTDIDEFLSGIKKGESVAIVGASTRYLIEEAVKRGLSVTVFDFSDVMLQALKNELRESCTYFKLDILLSIPVQYIGKFDYVISERLINRFTKNEVIRVYKNMYQLLSTSGEVRNAIKLGMYEMDKKMLKYAEENKLEASFYDADTKTIDYAKAKLILPNCLVDHGNISKDTLINWYLGRGKESRFSDNEIKEIIEINGNLIGVIQLSATKDLYLFRSNKKECVE